MRVDDAAALIAPAVQGTTWADLGAGGGTFTRALGRLLGPQGVVYAIDRDASAMSALGAALGAARAGRVVTHVADFANAGAWRSLPLPPLDGVLLANALHFVPAREQGAVLARVAERLAPGGRIVVVEYDDRPASRWVPYPVPYTTLGAIVPEGMTAPRRVGERRSAYGGVMYAAVSALSGA